LPDADIDRNSDVSGQHIFSRMGEKAFLLFGSFRQMSPFFQAPPRRLAALCAEGK